VRVSQVLGGQRGVTLTARRDLTVADWIRGDAKSRPSMERLQEDSHPGTGGSDVRWPAVRAPLDVRGENRARHDHVDD
ncbi:MAG: hypothetical protein L0H31_13745, partial [Nocardioidaceae bacterium]|nr:hypothetical protein [Nocardioidaceae bacterium]